MRILLAIVLTALSLVWCSMARAVEPGLHVYAPLASNNMVGPRTALILVPSATDSSARATIAHMDEQVYRVRLQDLGFNVLTVAAASRPEFDRFTRQAITRIEPGRDLVVFLLGNSAVLDGDLRILPSDAPPEAMSRPEVAETEALRGSDLLRRLSARLPRQIIVIVDGCISNAGTACDIPQAAAFANIDTLASYAASGSRPRSSLREDLLPLMAREGLNLNQLAVALQRSLQGTTRSIERSNALSTSFYFIPPNFFSGLNSDCNRVDRAAAAATIRTLDLGPLERACDAALRQWPYATWFKDQQSALREQQAFQRATSSCTDVVAASSFLQTYPSSRFRPIVEEFQASCRPRVPPPKPANELATAFIERYYYALSTAGERSGARLEPFYATKIRFYNNVISLQDAVLEKMKYFRQFPERSFSITEMSGNCDTGGRQCTVQGKVQYSIVKDDGALLRGITYFEYGVANPSSDPKIFSEYGRREQGFQ